MIIEDRRTPLEKKTHKYLAVATDTFLSGWGKARHGYSYAAWAYDSLEGAQKQVAHLKRRPEMKRVRLVTDYWRPRGTGHLSIYIGD